MTSVTSSSDDAVANKHRLVAGTFVALFIVATDSTAIGTLLPQMRAELGDISTYPWFLSAFFLTTTIASPIAGNASDRFGPRSTMLSALAVFILGSVAVAAALGPCQMVAARAVQGLGAGGVIVMSYVLVARIYGPHNRARAQGLLSSVWGLAAILGPLLAAVCDELVGWRVFFMLNVPAGVAIFALLYRMPGREPTESRPHWDVRPQILFAAFVAGCLVLVMTPSMGMDLVTWIAAGSTLVAGAALWSIVRRRPDASPIPIVFFKDSDYRVTALLALAASGALYSSVAVLPLALAERSYGSLTAGLTVGATALGWVLGAGVTPKLVVRMSYRGIASAGAMSLLAGGTTLAWMPTTAPVSTFLVSQLALGFGMGLVATTTLVWTQDKATTHDLGAFTSAVQLLRNLGGAFGVNAVAAAQAALGGRSFRPALFAIWCLTLGCVLAALMLPTGRVWRSRRTGISS